MTAQTVETPGEELTEETTTTTVDAETTGEDVPDVRIEVPPGATEEEATAIATAVAAHLTDRQRAAAAAARARDEPEYVSGWKLAGRLGVDRKGRLPRDVECGEVWQAADRSY